MTVTCRFASIALSLCVSASTASCVTSKATVGTDPPHWRVVPSPTATTLNGVWADRENDAWAVGDDGVGVHWDGTTWTATTIAPNVSFRAVWGTASSDVWAVGGDTATSLAFAAHFDGSVWSRARVIAGGAFTSVYMVSPVDGWMVQSPPNSIAGQLWHWDGTRWSLASPTIAARAVRGNSSGEVIAWITTNSATDAFVRRVAGGWSDPLPARGDDIGYVHANPVASAMWVFDAADFWISGGWWFHHTTDGWRNATGGFVVWDTDAGPRPGSNAVWGASPDEVWFVGSTGQIGRWDGAALVGVRSPSTETLRDVFGTGRLDVWAVGDAGTILHYGP
jgi:hypothetical protein